MQNVKLRAAKPDDLTGMQACIRAAYREIKAKLPDLPAVDEGLEQDLRDNKVIVATDGDDIAGVMVLILRPDHLKLANIAVHPAFGGRGVGGALLRAAEEAARTAGLKELRLVTHKHLPDNLAMYTYLGWEEYERMGNSVLFKKTPRA